MPRKNLSRWEHFFNDCLENFYMTKGIIGLSVILTIGGVALVGFKPKAHMSNLDVYSTAGLDLYYIAPNFDEIGVEEDKVFSDVKHDVFFSPKLGKSYVGFKEAVAFKESRGDYGVINQFGYLGKYQFGMGTLDLIGVKSKNKFLNDPALQEKAFYANLSRNKWILRKDIKRSVGKQINGIVITESGILAAAHLSGPGAVKKYLRSGGVMGFADAFGTTIRYYIKRFAGYDTSFVTPNRKAKV